MQPAFRVVSTAFGVVVVTVVDPAAAGLDALPAAERALAAPWGARRRATFAAGRHALRGALVAAGVVGVPDVIGPILRDDRGAPVLPPDLPGDLRVSVSHKDSHAAALVARVDDGGVHIGVDLELDAGWTRARVDGIARQTLRPAELDALPDDDVARRRAVLVRFSAKESLYKAVDKTLRRYVGFHEVGVDVAGDALAFSCPAGSGLRAAGVVVDVGDDGVLLTACHARPGAALVVSPA
ncbi:MAG: 4'-phosphopantetheinyl transferase superfamily protein [Deltaproteobacteria bacterium]|nr:4'-phosphopantetheinyl transferase superfamily protein [Deltaproteobacteria bacterium]